MTQEEKDAVVRGYMLRSAEKELITKVESMCYEFLKRVVMEFEEIRMKYCGRAAGQGEGAADQGAGGLRYYQLVLSKLLKSFPKERGMELEANEAVLAKELALMDLEEK